MIALTKEHMTHHDGYMILIISLNQRNGITMGIAKGITTRGLTKSITQEEDQVGYILLDLGVTNGGISKLDEQHFLCEHQNQ